MAINGNKIRKFAFTHNIHTLSRAAYLLLGRIDRITYVDAAYCYRPSSVVCRSVTLVSPAKMHGSTDRVAVWIEDSGGC